MNLTRVDAMVFVYTLGAALTGGLLVLRLGIENEVALVVLSLFAALIWTIYFRITMFPRLEDELTEDETEPGVQG